MARMTAKEGLGAYLNSAPPSYLVHYEPEVHDEEMKDLVTGLCGALLKTDLYSLSGPQLGSYLPVVITRGPNDLLRILIDPYIEPYGAVLETGLPYIEKAREHIELTALAYSGEGIVLDTKDIPYVNYRLLSAALQYQVAYLDTFTRAVPETALEEARIQQSLFEQEPEYQTAP